MRAWIQGKDRYQRVLTSRIQFEEPERLFGEALAEGAEAISETVDDFRTIGARFDHAAAREGLEGSGIALWTLETSTSESEHVTLTTADSIAIEMIAMAILGVPISLPNWIHGSNPMLEHHQPTVHRKTKSCQLYMLVLKNEVEVISGENLIHHGVVRPYPTVFRLERRDGKLSG